MRRAYNWDDPALSDAAFSASPPMCILNCRIYAANITPTGKPNQMDFISIIKLTIFAAGVSASAGGCLAC